MAKKRLEKWEPDAKSEIHLDMSSSEYREYRRDALGIDESEFVAKGSGEMGLGHDVRPEEIQEAEGKEPEHVAELAGEIRAAGEAQRRIDAEVSEMKYRKTMSKIAQVPEMVAMCREAAALTPEPDDDRRVERVAGMAQGRTCDDLPDIHDDGVTDEEYIPRSMRRFL